MPPSEPDPPDVAAVMRNSAAQVRRLITGLVFETDRQLLCEYAEELEARAAELERGG